MRNFTTHNNQLTSQAVEASLGPCCINSTRHPFACLTWKPCRKFNPFTMSSEVFPWRVLSWPCYCMWPTCTEIKCRCYTNIKCIRIKI